MTAVTKSQPRRHVTLDDVLVNGMLVLVVIVWSIPTMGLLVSSFRDRFDIQTSGWWTIFPHREWQMVSELPVPDNIDRNGIMTIQGASGTFEQFRAGVTTADGR